MALDLEDKGYEYGGAVAARYPGFTASKWATNYETETGERYRVIATKFTGDMVQMLCRPVPPLPGGIRGLHTAHLRSTG